MRHPQGCGLLQPPMRMTKQQLAKQTIANWQPRSPSPLSTEDAREITENVTGFFAILAEWSRKERRDQAVLECADTTASEGVDG